MVSDRGSDAPADRAFSESPREPYAGIVESIITKILVDPSSPRARERRKVIHRINVWSGIFVAAGGLVIIVSMIAALVSS
jgi:hypothetical protein